jgi:NAD+ kinase
VVLVAKALKVSVVSWTPGIVRKELKKAGLREAKAKPDVVVAFGGDGTFLFAEQKYPGVPKLLIKHDRTCNRGHDLSAVFSALKGGEYVIEEYHKFEAAVNGKAVLVAMNDFNIHYVPPCALRFSVKIDGKTVTEKVIGDGVVVATPYGSTAYYKSITRTSITHGIGVAFNNPTEPVGEVVANESSKIERHVIRGPGMLAADCNRRVVRLRDGDVVTIKKFKQPARLILLNGRPLKVEC